QNETVVSVQEGTVDLSTDKTSVKVKGEETAVVRKQGQKPEIKQFDRNEIRQWQQSRSILKETGKKGKKIRENLKEKKKKYLAELCYKNRELLMTTIILLSLAIGGISPFLGGYAKKMLGDILAKEILLLFYIGSIGTLTLMTRLNYKLFMGSNKRRQRFNLKSILPLALAMVSLGFGIYYKPKFSILDIAFIVIAIGTFFIMKYLRILDREFLSHLKINKRSLPEQINFYTMVFVMLNILLISFVLYI
ncbi:MAG: hypothetical protein ACLFU5_01590, partial [Thermoplasmata archaeon]